MIVGKKNSKKESKKTSPESEFGDKKWFLRKKNKFGDKNEFGDSFKSDPNIFQIAETNWIC